MRPPALLAALLLPALGLGDQKVEALLAKMRAAYGAIQSAELVTDSTTTQPRSDYRLRVTVRTLFQRPYRIRATILGIPGRKNRPVVYVTDGSQVHVSGLPTGDYFPGFDRFQVSQLTLCRGETLSFWDHNWILSTAPGANLHGLAVSMRSEQWQNKAWTVLEARSRRGSTTRYFVEPKTYIIRRAVALAANGTVRSDCRLVSYRTGVRIDPKSFSVRAPAGASSASVSPPAQRPSTRAGR